MDDDQITLEFGRVISVTASGSTRATTIQLAAVGSEGDDDGAERGDAVEVLQPAGLMAAPAVTATTEAPFIRLGDRQVALGLIDKGAAAQNVEGGETRVYGSGASNAQTVIRLRANGDIEITAGSTHEVVINGGTLKVARVTDPVRIGTLTAIAGPYPVTFTTVLQDAAGVPLAPVVGPTAALSGFVSTAGGAARTKA